MNIQTTDKVYNKNLSNSEGAFSGKAKGRSGQVQLPSVSVVIPALNAEKTITDSIESFLRQSYKPLEIIVVDDGSTDLTSAVVRSINYSYVPISLIVLNKNSGPAFARNIGLREARGKIVCFAESDGMYSRHYLKKCIIALKDGGEKSFCSGGMRVCYRKSLFWADFWDAVFEARWWLQKNGKRLPRGGWIFYKETIMEAGGYNDSLREGEDTELSLRLIQAGCQCLWVSNLFMKHLEPQSISSVSKRFFNAGRRTIAYRLINKTLLSDFIGACGLITVSILIPINIVLIPLVVLLIREVRIAWYRVLKKITRGQLKIYQGFAFPYQYFFTKLASSVGIIYGMYISGKNNIRHV